MINNENGILIVAHMLCGDNKEEKIHWMKALEQLVFAPSFEWKIEKNNWKQWVEASNFSSQITIIASVFSLMHYYYRLTDTPLSQEIIPKIGVKRLKYQLYNELVSVLDKNLEPDAHPEIISDILKPISQS